MVRIFGILTGLFFAVAVMWSFVVGAINFAGEGMPHSVERSFYKHPKELTLASDGVRSEEHTSELQSR